MGLSCLLWRTVTTLLADLFLVSYIRNRSSTLLWPMQAFLIEGAKMFPKCIASFWVTNCPRLNTKIDKGLVKWRPGTYSLKKACVQIFTPKVTRVLGIYTRTHTNGYFCQNDVSAYRFNLHTGVFRVLWAGLSYEVGKQGTERHILQFIIQVESLSCVETKKTHVTSFFFSHVWTTEINALRHFLTWTNEIDSGCVPRLDQHPSPPPKHNQTDRSHQPLTIRILRKYLPPYLTNALTEKRGRNKKTFTDSNTLWVWEHQSHSGPTFMRWTSEVQLVFNL